MDEVYVDEIVGLSRSKLCHYLIFDEDTVFHGDFGAYGFEVFDKMHGFVIYKDTMMNFGLD